MALPASLLVMTSSQRAGRLAAWIAGWQAAAVCLLLPISLPARVAAGSAIAGLVAALSVRYHGRALPEWLTARRRFRQRVRRGQRRPRIPIEAVVPGVDTRGHADRAGNRVGLLADGPAWTAVLRLDPIPDQPLVDRLRTLLDELAAVVGDDRLDVDAAQLLGWSVPATAANPGPGSPPVLRTFWVAVRMLPTLHPASVAARGGGEQGEVRSAATAALRLATRLRQRGYGLRVLDGSALTDELGSSLGLAPPPRNRNGRPLPVPVRPPVPAERWRWWSLGGLHHACFRVRRPPRQQARLAVMFGLLAKPPAVTTCVSVVFRRGGPAEGEVFVRVAVSADRDPRAVRAALRRAAAGLPGRLAPMHGEHLPGVRATIPLAATP
ncbi:MAG TPA: type VII secretion protein EccE [Natronosporangium sp.]